MTEYLYDKRDVEFTLFEHLHLEGVTELPKYGDFSREDFQIILDEAGKVATGLLAPLNKSGDEEGVRLEDGKVYTPKGFDAAYKTFCEGGWVSPHASYEMGGQGLPLALTAALLELFIGANSSFMFWPGLTSAASHLIEVHGSEEQKRLFVNRLNSGEWAGTMCLTEPQAGSAVGELSTSAAEVEGEDYFLITGSKIFISAGDHDLTDNIIHLVLARVPGDPSGTKGLSLFIVPKIRIDEDGNLTEPNDVVTPSIEHKMGIHASPTCVLNFGDDGNCRGWLVGERRQGIVYMFQMMNEARITCGIQGVALGNAAYQHALAYARERIQGAKVTDRSKDAKAVPIIEHPDVRRNLMLMKSMGEGIRALVLKTAYYADQAISAPDDADRTRYEDLVELLTPIVKAYCTDQGFWMTERAIQVLGGYGYIREYPVEQYMRDIKIASIYEGTNGIQALDLLGRKMRLKNGGLFLNWLQEVNKLVNANKGHERLADVVGAVDKAKNKLAEVVFGFPKMGKKDPELFVLQATPFLELFGHVEVARLLLEQALVADEALQRIFAEGGADDDESQRALVAENSQARFYDGKLKGATFFANHLLPNAFTLARSIAAGDRSALDIAF